MCARRRMFKEPIRTLGIGEPEEKLRTIDKIISHGWFANRTEFYRAASTALIIKINNMAIDLSNIHFYDILDIDPNETKPPISKKYIKENFPESYEKIWAEGGSQ